MKIIGITGGIGAGKSTVLGYLAENYRAKVILADDVANELKKPGGACYGPILELLGTEILQKDGTICNKIMGKRIFSDEQMLYRVNEIVHPSVKRLIQQEIQREKEKGTAVFVIESALLLEVHYEEFCDEVWYIDTEEKIRRMRLKVSRGYSDEYIDRIVKKQMSRALFFQKCDVVIDNGSKWEKTKEQIDIRMLENEIR